MKEKHTDTFFFPFGRIFLNIFQVKKFRRTPSIRGFKLEQVMENTFRKWSSRDITEVLKHRDKNTGPMKNVCMLTVSSKHIETFKEGLDVEASQ